MNKARHQKIGIMGGTFDPIHNGHLVAANEVANLYNLDQVIFTPTGIPWQKVETHGRSITAAEDRYLMTVIATASNPKFNVSRVDIDRNKQTFTIDTLRDIKEIYPDAELFFITGVDALNSIFSWVDVEKLFSYAKFIGVTRPGYDLKEGILANIVATGGEGSVKFVEIPALAISSTDCRQRAQAGRPVWYLIPDGVVQYINKNNLYKQGSEQ